MPRQYTRIAPAERFWKFVNKTDTCWLWTGSTHLGYGRFKPTEKTIVSAHRFSYELTYGPIPDGMLVCHNCPDGDNPACVNPAHLFLGTQSENIQDMYRKGRGSSVRARGDKSSARLHPPKLSREKAQEIRSLHARGDITQAAIAMRFGVAPCTVGDIIAGRTWSEPE